MRVASPYVRSKTTNSKLIHELMDAQDAQYVKVTPSLEGPTRGYQISTLKSISVHDNYSKQASKQLKKGAKNNSSLEVLEQERTIQKKTLPAVEKKFDQRWYHFYNRQVFSLGQIAITEDEHTPTTKEAPRVQRLASCKLLLRSTSTDSIKQGVVEGEIQQNVNEKNWSSCPMNDDIYEACFDDNWAMCGMEKVVRDAVERNRVHSMLRSHARILFHLFRLYSSLNGSSDRDPFKLATKSKFFEDLTIVIVEPARYGINDQPTSRSGFLVFIMLVAQCYFKRDEVAGLLKRLLKDGLETSSCLHYLFQDFILPYASIEDPLHFQLLFKQPPIQKIFLLHQAGLQAAFLQHAEPITQDPSLPPCADNDRLPNPYMKFQSFLIFLHFYKQIDIKFTESRASVIFCSCLAVWPDENAIISKALDYRGFTLALTKVIFAKYEKAICNEDEHICPARALSERCRCAFEDIKSNYNLHAFLEPLTAIITKAAAPGIKRGGRRRSLVNGHSQL
ncbi:hypothetical protein THRCLA_02090 [Thraustotheca clavata]|uniref:Uncharacterized protein n=1 Tax=Thraustotheca clavata TaxID=74557 RepID=A0A1W0A6D4_9STRA|nr:hypothetical protein THRCLA_02090 [Thraustotheca clavata]